MHTKRTARIASVSLLLALGASALTTCSAVDDVFDQDRTNTFENKAGYETADLLTADWIPNDSTKIKLRTPSDTAAGVGAILLRSKSKLPASCTERARRSAPLLSFDQAPDVYANHAKKVYVCGTWTVIAAKGGWFGWTPNAEDRGA